MSTLYNKKQAIEWLKRNVKDDQYVVLSMDMVGSVTSNNKKKYISATFAFASDGFVGKGDVRNIAFGHTPSFSMVVCDRTHLDERVLKEHDEFMKPKKK